jgi:hypothetical protein
VVENGDLPAVDSGAALTNGKPEAQSGTIPASLFERTKQLLGFARRQTSALIFNVDEYAIGRLAGAQRNATARASELERVLKRVSHHRCEDLPIPEHGHVVRHRDD